jgi:AAA+ superfamily predicted ATPase
LVALKNIYEKENLYLKRKRKTYTIYSPSTLKKEPFNIQNNNDFYKALKVLNSNLVFSHKQTTELIIIINEIKKNIIKNIIYGKQNPNTSLRFPYTTQIFFSGPPGTGKTETIYLLSEILGIPIVILSSSALLLMGNESIRVMEELLNDVEFSGAFLYIDEAELILMNRSSLINNNQISHNNMQVHYSEILHKLFTTFLSKTGNQRHNLIIASSKVNIIDQAMARRIKYFFSTELPDKFALNKIILKIFSKHNMTFTDLSNEEAANLIIKYNEKLKQINNNVDFSHRDIESIILSLKSLNKSFYIDEILHYQSNSYQLQKVIEEKINLQFLFNMEENEEVNGESGSGYDYLDSEKSYKYQEQLSQYNNELRNQIAGLLYHDQNFDGLVYPTLIKNKYNNMGKFIQNYGKQLSHNLLNQLKNEFKNRDEYYGLPQHYYKKSNINLGNIFYINSYTKNNNLYSSFQNHYKKNQEINMISLFIANNTSNSFDSKEMFNVSVNNNKYKSRKSNLNHIKQIMINDVMNNIGENTDDEIIY